LGIPALENHDHYLRFRGLGEKRLVSRSDFVAILKCANTSFFDLELFNDIEHDKLERMRQDVAMACLKVLYQHLAGWNE
jgi:hypothetical protein